MGVPFLLSLAITYTAGAIVHMPFQLAFAIYDTAVFIKKAGKYTSKGILYIRRYRANHRYQNLTKKLPAVPVVDGYDWTMLSHDSGNTSPAESCSDALIIIPEK